MPPFLSVSKFLNQSIDLTFLALSKSILFRLIVIPYFFTRVDVASTNRSYKKTLLRFYSKAHNYLHTWGTVGVFLLGCFFEVTQPLRATGVNLFSDFTIKDRWKVLGGVDFQSFRCQFSNGTFQNIGGFGGYMLSGWRERCIKKVVRIGFLSLPSFAHFSPSS